MPKKYVRLAQQTYNSHVSLETGPDSIEWINLLDADQQPCHQPLQQLTLTCRPERGNTRHQLLQAVAHGKDDRIVEFCIHRTLQDKSAVPREVDVGYGE